MPCPQCDDPMECIGIQNGFIVHRCPVCGTQLTGGIPPHKRCIEVPQLLAKLRQFQKEAVDGGDAPWVARAWADLGIQAIIKRERPT